MASWLAILSGCAPVPDAATAEKFRDAQHIFDTAKTPEDFLQAASLYQEVLDGGVVSGAVLYNQGNAFMQAGERGRAIACYRQAERYRPLDKDLQHNLSNALGDLGSGEEASIVGALLFWQDWISYRGKFQLLGFSAAATFLFGLVALYASFGRRTSKVLGWTACGVTLLFALSAVYDWHRFESVQRGVVTRDEVTARQGNAESYEPAFTQPLGEGVEFTVVETRNDWLKIRLSEDKEGWIQTADCVIY